MSGGTGLGRHDDAEPFGSEALHKALLEFRRAPAKHLIHAREPALVFASLREVIQLAIGREGDTDSECLQDAACAFVKAAMLFPTADHYAVLGLQPGAGVAVIKQRYRMMMRLLHPDFASKTGMRWPADAASRVNLAYETLASPISRRRYDEQQGHIPHAPATPPKAAVRPPRLARPRRTASDADRRDRWVHIGIAASFSIAMVLMGVLFAGNSDPIIELVQRAPHPSPAVAEAVKVAVNAQSEVTRRPRAPPGSPASLASSAVIAAPFAPSAPLSPPPLPERALPPAPSATPATLPAPEAVREPRPEPPAASTSLALARPMLEMTPSLPRPLDGPTTVAAFNLPGTRPLTMVDAHPLLARLLQHMESGAGERLLYVLEPSARSTPAAQSVLQQYNSLVEGARPVRISNVQFSGEPREGRLVVIGQVSIHAGASLTDAAPRPFSIQAEFALKDGAVVMTRLARLQN